MAQKLNSKEKYFEKYENNELATQNLKEIFSGYAYKHLSKDKITKKPSFSKRQFVRIRKKFLKKDCLRMPKNKNNQIKLNRNASKSYLRNNYKYFIGYDGTKKTKKEQDFQAYMKLVLGKWVNGKKERIKTFILPLNRNKSHHNGGNESNKRIVKLFDKLAIWINDNGSKDLIDAFFSNNIYITTDKHRTPVNFFNSRKLIGFISSNPCEPEKFESQNFNIKNVMKNADLEMLKAHPEYKFIF